MNAPEAHSDRRWLTGGCLCGATDFRVADAFRYALYCHCSQCRRTTGSAFKALAGIERDQFVLVKGQDALLIYGDEAGHDAHCGRCGSWLYSIVRAGLYVHVAMGALADAPTIRPTMHIFVESKAPWFEITDALPQFGALPPS